MNHEENPKPVGTRDSLDRYLDRVLLSVNGEPRPGLEQRILTRLQSAPKKFHWWKWGVVPAFAALAVLAIVARPSKSWWSPPSSMPQVARSANGKPILTQSTPPPTPQSPQATLLAQNASTASEYRRYTVVAVHDHREKLPKLPTFPSAQPLSRQELLLVALVRNHPEQLKQIADWQQEFTKSPDPKALNPDDGE